MLIANAEAIYYGSTEIEKAILDNEIVWGKLYLRSRNVLTAEGFPTGSTITKDGASAIRTTRAANLPGNTDMINVARSYWADWGNDIFDTWGFFYLYDPEFQNYRGIVLNDTNFNAADGTISTQTFTLNSRTFTVKYGYPVQGIFKFDISVNDNKDFQFGFDGNLGSNGSTVNNVLAYDYTIGSQSFRLHYNNNYQGTLPSESFYTYVVPYDKNQNKLSSTYVRRVYDIDNLALYSVPVKKGVTVYLSKQVDVREWVVNDLELSSL
jgi:hypothetical protein